MNDIGEYTDRATLLGDLDTILLLALEDIMRDVPSDQVQSYLDTHDGVKLLATVVAKLTALP